HGPVDLVALGADVVAEAGAGARVRREQPAHHADRRGLAAAVGAEEAQDLPARRLQGEIVDDVFVAEMLVEPVDVDRQGGAGPLAHFRVTATGWPGRVRARA